MIPSDSPEPEMEDRSGGSNQNEQLEPYQKKQKRQHTPSACESCHSNHLKCDGNSPCLQCDKRKMECIYSTPGKRGPKPGASSLLKSKLAQQEFSIQILTDELNKTKAEVKYWRDKYHATVGETNSPILGGTKIDDPFSQERLNLYMLAFQTYVAPFHPSSNSIEKLDLPLYLSDNPRPEDALTCLKVCISLAHGARMAGRSDHSEEFMRKTKLQVREFFQQSNLELAYIFLLISYYFFGSGDSPKSSYFTALSHKCFEESELPNPTLKRRCIALFTTQTPGKEEIQPFLTQLEDTALPDLVWTTFAWIFLTFSGPWTNQPQTLFQSFQRIESMLQPPESVVPLQKMNVETLIFSARAGLFWKGGSKTEALSWAELALKHFNLPIFIHSCPFVICAIDIVTQVFLSERKKQQVINCLVALNRLATIYPIALLLKQRYERTFELALQALKSGRPYSSLTPSPNFSNLSSFLAITETFDPSKSPKPPKQTQPHHSSGPTQSSMTSDSSVIDNNFVKDPTVPLEQDSPLSAVNLEDFSKLFQMEEPILAFLPTSQRQDGIQNPREGDSAQVSCDHPTFINLFTL